MSKLTKVVSVSEPPLQRSLQTKFIKSAHDRENSTLKTSTRGVVSAKSIKNCISELPNIIQNALPKLSKTMAMNEPIASFGIGPKSKSLSASPSRGNSKLFVEKNESFRLQEISLRRSERAKRVRFYHNGNVFFKGVLIPISEERYRTFSTLLAELTDIFTRKVTIPCGVRNVFTMDGNKVFNLCELEDGKEYVCAGKGETFKNISYGKSYTNSRWKCTSKADSIPDKLTNCEIQIENFKPRYIIIIPSGHKPRRVQRMFLNKRNASNIEQLLKNLTEVADLESGAVRKVFTLAGDPVSVLSQYFNNLNDDVFFLFGNQTVARSDLKIIPEEHTIIEQLRKLNLPY